MQTHLSKSARCARVCTQQPWWSANLWSALCCGALAKASADIGIAVSGVAGPGGGTEEKPVGTVWLAWGTETKNDAIRLQIPGSRERFQILVAAIGLDLMRRQVLNLPPIPHYIKRFVYRNA